jgi:hypothetical protein
MNPKSMNEYLTNMVEFETSLRVSGKYPDVDQKQTISIAKNPSLAAFDAGG